MFAGEPRSDIQDAFTGALEVLGDIAVICPQAKVYHGILTDFAEAVSKYRQLVTQKIRQTVDHYLDQVPFLELAEEPGLPRASSSIATLRAEADRIQDLGVRGLVDEMDVDLEIIWSDLDLRLIDNSLVGFTEPFQGLFCSVE